MRSCLPLSSPGRRTSNGTALWNAADVREEIFLLAKPLHVEIGHRLLGHHEAAGVSDALHGPHEHGPVGAVDVGGETDGEPHRENSDKSEYRRLDEGAHGVLQVAAHLAQVLKRQTHGGIGNEAHYAGAAATPGQLGHGLHAGLEHLVAVGQLELMGKCARQPLIHSLCFHSVTIPRFVRIAWTRPCSRTHSASSSWRPRPVSR